MLHIEQWQYFTVKNSRYCKVDYGNIEAELLLINFTRADAYPQLLKAGVLEKLQGLRICEVRPLPLISVCWPACTQVCNESHRQTLCPKIDQ